MGGWKRWNVERGGLEYTFDLGDCSTCANSTWAELTVCARFLELVLGD